MTRTKALSNTGMSAWLLAAATIWLTACAPEGTQGTPDAPAAAETPAQAAEQDAAEPSQAAGTTAKTANESETTDDLEAAKEPEAAENAAAEPTPATPVSPADAGRAFLAENAKRDGVVVADSGLQYEVLVSGDGPKPGPTDTVTTHYHGTFVDGSIFDSSVRRGSPASFPVNGVIKCWTEALQMMKVGDKWKITCPPELAYGASGRSGIPPSSTLIFEVELLAVQPGR